MSVLSRMLTKGWSASSIGQTFSQPDFWTVPELWWSSPVGDKEKIPDRFEEMVAGVYKRNGIVFACIQARMAVFSEATFQFQRMAGGQPGDLFGTQALGVLEEPWLNGTTGELLSRALQDVDMAGNFFLTRTASGKLRRLRPDWVTIITGSPSDDPFDIDAEPVGYVYQPPRTEGVLLLPGQVAHWSPIPDPEAQWRGMSWLTPVLREIDGDGKATDHKAQFFKQGATSNYAVVYDKSVEPAKVKTLMAMFDAAYSGSDKAYKTLHIGGGGDIKTVGNDMRQLDFKATQGAGETRIAAAAGVPPVWAGFSEGLAGSSLNAGNFAAARRRFADGTIRPLWRSCSAALSKLVDVPADARLAVATKHIAFLREDAKDAAEILGRDAETVARLVDAGFDPDSAVAAVKAGDLSMLRGKHSGLYSVQLQPAGAQTQRPEPAKQSHTINVDARPTVTIPAQEPLVVDIKQEAPVVNLTVEPPAVDARSTVHVAPAEVTVVQPEQGKQTTRKEIKHGPDGRIVEIIEVTE